MASLEIQLSDLSIGRTTKALARAATFTPLKNQLLEDLAGLIEAQTKRRIADEKTGPDGAPWEPWSDAYAATRGPQHSLLIDTGNLLDDIAAEVAGRDAVRVGTTRVYGPRNQAQRPYLGVSEDNAREIEQEALDSLQAAVGGLWRQVFRR